VSFDDWVDFAGNTGPWVVTSEGDEVVLVRSRSAPTDHDPCSA
jgi:hypothetical protein